MIRIAVGSDHGGFQYKEEIKKYLSGKYDVIDVGTTSNESCDYPIFGKKAAILVATGTCEYGILICTSGEGIMIVANKVKNARCALGYNDSVTKYSRKHNDANMISFGAAYMPLEDVLKRIDIFLNTPFDGGRHKARVDQIE